MVVKPAVTGWRERYADKLMSPQDAMGVVKNGDYVWLGLLNSVPTTLCAGLAARAGAIKDVTVVNMLTPFNWDRPELLDSFRILSGYAGPLERTAIQAGRFDYAPIGGFREGRMPNGINYEYDVAGLSISPPDEDGYCSFGDSVFFNPSVMKQSKLLVGEIHPDHIRTGGENSVHISRFARLCEAALKPPPAPIPPRSEETIYAAEVICTLTATELIPDRATLQLGIGDVSAAMGLYLFEKHDLGIHTELLPGGIVELVRRGVVTGRYKEVHPGKVVASLSAQLSPEELAQIDGDPTYELYDFNHTDDLRVILQFSNFVAVNNALYVDLTGNVCSETIGTRLFSGPGGQPTFAYAASVISNSSIIVLPSSQLVDGVRYPRIVAMLPEGSTQTVHRSFVDYVVTEQGIAHLSNRPIRERIRELIAVAHPDFRAELREHAKRLYSVSV